MYLLTERDWTGALHLLAGLLMIAAALALLFVTVSDGSEEPLISIPMSQPDAGPAPQIEVRTAAAGERFGVAGASFRVVSEPRTKWASASRAQTAGAGHRWIVVAVQIENLGRRRFNPALLSYLLRTPSGGLSAPAQAGIVGPAGLGMASGLPVGATAQQRLVYRIPAGLRQPILTLQPSPTRAIEVRVPLGAG